MPTWIERSTIQGLLVVVLASALLLLAGCRLNPLKPEAEAQARAADAAPESVCAANCETAKAQCESRQRLREQLCLEQATRLQNGAASGPSATRPLNPQPMACLGEDLSLCRVQHTECLSRCTIPPAPAPATERAES